MIPILSIPGELIKRVFLDSIPNYPDFKICVWSINKPWKKRLGELVSSLWVSRMGSVVLRDRQLVKLGNPEEQATAEMTEWEKSLKPEIS